MIEAPISSRSRCSAAFTLPCVPTGMKAGVSTTPCGVVSVPSRAAPSEARSEKANSGDTLLLSVGTSLAKKLRVGVIYGGRSGEHEVSIASAASICSNLDPARYETVPIHIAKDGKWSLPPAAPKSLSAAEVLRQVDSQALQVVEPTRALSGSHIDVVFPIVHGPYGEDGTVQGLL